MIVMGTTKMYKNGQTAIPSVIRKEFNINENTIIEWGKDNEGNFQVKLRKKPSFDDLAGIGHSEEKTNAVKLKKELYK